METLYLLVVFLLTSEGAVGAQLHAEEAQTFDACVTELQGSLTVWLDELVEHDDNNVGGYMAKCHPMDKPLPQTQEDMVGGNSVGG